MQGDDGTGGGSVGIVLTAEEVKVVEILGDLSCSSVYFSLYFDY